MRQDGITLLKYILAVIILIFLIFIFIRSNSKKSTEKYNNEKVFPENEAKYIIEKENQWGIPQCKYGGYTPILTCSYDSKV
jgi:cell division protein FtsN